MVCQSRDFLESYVVIPLCTNNLFHNFLSLGSLLLYFKLRDYYVRNNELHDTKYFSGPKIMMPLGPGFVWLYTHRLQKFSRSTSTASKAGKVLHQIINTVSWGASGDHRREMQTGCRKILVGRELCNPV